MSMYTYINIIKNNKNIVTYKHLFEYQETFNWKSNKLL